MKSWNDFKEKWVVDYEFISNNGNPPIPICYVAKNVDTCQVIRHWVTKKDKKPKYSIGNDSLIIAYYASAEMGCHKALNFGIPLYLLDLYAEFRCLTNGITVPSGNGLIGACNYFGISSSDAVYKDMMRDRILEGYPFTRKEQEDILDYCQKDTDMTANLFQELEEYIDLTFALLRGRYVACVAEMEYYGVPIDTEKLEDLRKYWNLIKEELIYRVDQQYHVYEGITFKIAKFQKYLEDHEIPWKYTSTGLPRTDNTYMHEQIKTYPELRALQELRYSLGQLKLKDLQVGNDGRNRCLLSPFRSKTSRNQPSTSKFIFGNATWLRHLIKPDKGMALSYIDYEQQEIAIAGALSCDKNLIAAYESGDPYLSFAKAAGAIPADGTKETHHEIREKYKTCMLALNYGMTTKTFAEKARIPLSEAELMVKMHKIRYRRYWDWSAGFIDIGLLSGEVETKFHWKLATGQAKERTLMNWPMQSNGADILRLAICFCIEQGIKVIAPIHDAILVEDTIENIDNTVSKAQKCMEEASRYIIGYKIRTEAKIIRFPDRYVDPRGAAMWESVWEVVNNLKENGTRKKKLLTNGEERGCAK